MQSLLHDAQALRSVSEVVSKLLFSHNFFCFKQVRYVYVIARAGVIFGIYFTALPKMSGIYPIISRLPVLKYVNTMATQRGRYITFFTLVDDISRW